MLGLFYYLCLCTRPHATHNMLYSQAIQTYRASICDHLQEVRGSQNDPGGGVQPDIQLAQVLL